MSSNSPSDELTRARKLLLPIVSTQNDRQALLNDAFYSYQNVLHRIRHSDDSYTFATLCITTLLNHGCLTRQEHALSRLLSTARPSIGVEQHPEIDDLIALLNERCTGKKSEPTLAVAPVPDSPVPAQEAVDPEPEAIDPVPPPPVAKADSTLPPPPNNQPPGFAPIPPPPKRPQNMWLAIVNGVLIFVIAAIVFLKLFPLLESVQIAVLGLFGLGGFLLVLVTRRALRELKDAGVALADRYIDHLGVTAVCLIMLIGIVAFLPQCTSSGCSNPQPDSTDEAPITTPEQTSTVALEPTRCGDQDGDGVCDSADACPALSARTPDGCPGEATDTPVSQPTSASQANIVPTDTASTAETGLPDEVSSMADYVNLEIYWDEDSFTMYVPDQETINLADLTFIAGNKIISASEESDIPLDPIESPFCIHFYWQSVDDSPVVPNKCDAITTYSIPYPNRPDVFWLQSNGNRPIVKIDVVVGNTFRKACSYGANWCVPFSP